MARFCAGMIRANTDNTGERESAPVVKTTGLIEAGDSAQLIPEFGRVRDVQKVFGLKRGAIYQLIRDGKLKSVSLRRPGARTGLRLIHLASVRAFLEANLQ